VAVALLKGQAEPKEYGKCYRPAILEGVDLMPLRCQMAVVELAVFHFGMKTDDAAAILRMREWDVIAIVMDRLYREWEVKAGLTGRERVGGKLRAKVGMGA
jgi:hypothetical protein